MISCNSCKFNVSESMKFALMQNVCPSCGSPLFSQKDNNIIVTIQSRIASQSFSSDLSHEQIYDFSLFMFNEIKNGIGAIIFQEMAAASKKVLSTEDGKEVLIDDIKKEIGEEYLADLPDVEEHEEDLDEDPFIRPVVEIDLEEKADRLKRMHQSRKLGEGAKGAVTKAKKTSKPISRLG